MIANNFLQFLLKRSSPLLVQCCGVRRKPLWLPVAKSKIYRIPKKPVVSQEERLELMRVNNNYKTQMRAIRWFYYEEMVKERSSFESASSDMSQKVEAEEWERCLAENDKWNKEVAVEREKRRAKELDQMQQYALARMEAKDNERRKRVTLASQQIRHQKELSSTFITAETLEAAIEHALANPVDYNYAIDSQGQRHGDINTTMTQDGKDKSTTATTN